jgi:MFS family permease
MIQNAQSNSYCGNNKDHQAVKLNLLHAGYGIGAFAAPLSSTYFSGTVHWNYQYLISCCLAVSNLIAICFVFRGRRAERVSFLLTNTFSRADPTLQLSWPMLASLSHNQPVKGKDKEKRRFNKTYSKTLWAFVLCTSALCSR